MSETGLRAKGQARVPRVLLVDDEAAVRTALARGLRAEGMTVVTAADGPAALLSAQNDAFDVIVLDIIIPGLSGYRVLQRLRAEQIDTPVLLISAKDGEVDQADGLDLGADGYLVKPFSFLVLVARIRALLRRREVVEPVRRRTLRLGELTMNTTAKTVHWKDRPVELTPREFTLLHTLVSAQDTVLRRDQLLEAVWGGHYAATPNAVEVYIGYVRRKLAAAGAPNLIQTLRGRGYQASVGSKPRHRRR